MSGSNSPVVSHQLVFPGFREEEPEVGSVHPPAPEEAGRVPEESPGAGRARHRQPPALAEDPGHRARLQERRRKHPGRNFRDVEHRHVQAEGAGSTTLETQIR